MQEHKIRYAPRLADGSFLTIRMERTGSIMSALKLGNEEDIINIVNRLYTGTESVEICKVRVTYQLEESE